MDVNNKEEFYWLEKEKQSGWVWGKRNGLFSGVVRQFLPFGRELRMKVSHGDEAPLEKH